MNVKRFTARTSREALALVKQAFGDDAVVVSNRPCADGVEVLAMGPESLSQLERVAASVPLERTMPPTEGRAASRLDSRIEVRADARLEPRLDAAAEARPDAAVTSVEQDVQQLSMSTLSFQDYVRERMLKRRQSELTREAAPAEAPRRESASRRPAVEPEAAAELRARSGGRSAHREPPVLREEIRLADTSPAVAAAAPALAPEEVLRQEREREEMLAELRSMRGLIEQRFGALAFMEKLQRQPRQAQLTQKMLDCGFSPSLARKLVESLPDDVEENAWATSVLERNLATGANEPALEDVGGVYAMIGSTGVGKTTSTAKLAAAFATRHGAANLGLITLDAYRVGAHEQLRTYGRILGVPVHTAHDRASLEDLLDLLSGKKMVLIDTAGMAQRDTRTRELLEMLSHRAIQRLLVVNAAAQGETIDDVLVAWGAAACRGVVLSKVDEAVKTGPALDALIRHKLKVLAVANGQRVPEDWHRLSAAALVQRALKGGGSPAWRLDSGDVNLVFAGGPTVARAAASAGARGIHA
jgi:flagellar biosynthesis protein FlhF